MAGNIVKINDGSYRLRYKDESKHVKAKSDRETQRLLAAFITEIDSGNFEKPQRLTLSVYILILFKARISRPPMSWNLS